MSSLAGTGSRFAKSLLPTYVKSLAQILGTHSSQTDQTDQNL